MLKLSNVKFVGITSLEWTATNLFARNRAINHNIIITCELDWTRFIEIGSLGLNRHDKKRYCNDLIRENMNESDKSWIRLTDLFLSKSADNRPCELSLENDMFSRPAPTQIANWFHICFTWIWTNIAGLFANNNTKVRLSYIGSCRNSLSFNAITLKYVRGARAYGVDGKLHRMLLDHSLTFSMCHLNIRQSLQGEKGRSQSYF